MQNTKPSLSAGNDGFNIRRLTLCILVRAVKILLPLRVLPELCAGVYEWEAALNVSTGQVYYINNVNSNKVRKSVSCWFVAGLWGNIVLFQVAFEYTENVLLPASDSTMETPALFVTIVTLYF